MTNEHLLASDKKLASTSILILDFGSQYTQLIARRIREMGVYCELHPCILSEEKIRAFNPNGIILSGGPDSVTQENTPRAPKIVFELGIPVLGICYGMQTMAAQMGGEVKKGIVREFGFAELKVHVDKPSSLLAGLEDYLAKDNHALLDVWMSHGDHVSKTPPGFDIIASSPNCAIAGMANESKRFYGLQFHPEVAHTRQGAKMIEKFVVDICGCKKTWTTHNIYEESIKQIKQEVGNEKVILGLSGGVDSSVLAALLHKSIGKQLTCVFVDTGLMRLNEVEEVKNLFAKHMQINLIVVDAAERFYKALANVVDPEQKRKIIGKVFVEIFEEEAAKIEDAKWLAQGTIYPDVIESAETTTGTGKAHVIKSHHNVGGLPKDIKLKLLEPFRELFKDEVRKLGEELGLPYDLIYRHPFPGPGLAIRIIGEIKKEYIDIVRLADAILLEELHKNNLYYKVSQAFVVFLPIKSVGVLGDARHYAHVVAIRIVESQDFMTAHIARLAPELLEGIANRIINEVHGISRVVYDISGKPPATIEWE